MKQPLILLGAFGLALLVSFALAQTAPPAWWTGANTTIIDANATQGNYTLVNLGQLKDVAYMARTYFNGTLGAVGGAGPDIENLVNSFSTSATINYESATIGQLKTVAQPFYDKLNEIGYNTTLNLQNRSAWGNYSWYYPWNPYALDSTNYELATIGQVKAVFSFNITTYITQNTTMKGPLDFIKVYRGWNPAGNDTDGDGSNDTVDVFPLDSNFKAVPAGSATNGTKGPNLTLIAPLDALKGM
jgi:hypothetical protein